MKSVTLILCLLCLVVVGQDAGSSSRAKGIWKWDFKMPDGTQVTPRLKIEEKDGKLVGKTEFKPNTEVEVQELSASPEQLAFKVVRENGGRKATTRYNGKISGKTLKGQIVTDWNGKEETFPWEARKIEGLEGKWKWSSSFGGRGSDSTLDLKQDGDKLTGKVSGGRSRNATSIKEGKLLGEEVSFELEREFGETKFVTLYTGKLDADKIIGISRTINSDNPRTNTWEATRVE